jgi:protein-arginine kinase activator protein McsA
MKEEDLFGNKWYTCSDETRFCRKCGEEKDLIDFHVPYYGKNNKEGRSYTCKSCKKEHVGVVSRLKDKNPPPKNKVCDCCGDASDNLHLDHDHLTKKFRGYLCVNCNHGLGKFNDQIHRLEKAIDYLKGSK